jgi:hypothetical protein
MAMDWLPEREEEIAREEDVEDAHIAREGIPFEARLVGGSLNSHVLRGLRGMHLHCKITSFLGE